MNNTTIIKTHVPFRKRARVLLKTENVLVMSEVIQKIVVGSKNPVKVNSVLNALTQIFPDVKFEIEGVSAPSGVTEQPMDEAETLLGAKNRVEYIKRHHCADWYAAIEGGVDDFDYGPATFAYVVIEHQGYCQVGRSTNLPLPSSIYSALCQGEELGHVMDRVFNTDNIKQKGGAMALLTNGLVTRESVYTLALTTTIAPFINKELFQQ